MVSLRQLKIAKRAGILTVTDLESTEGTYLNGVKLLPNVEYPIWGGAELAIGEKKLVRLYIRSTRSWLLSYRQNATAQWNNR